MNFIIKEATEEDLPFLVEAIINAERSGTQTLSYEKLFELDEQQVINNLSKILAEDITGQELCISDFLIAWFDEERAAAICSWIEGEEGSSAILKSNVLMFGFGKEAFARVLHKAALLEPLNMTREAGALQLESVYVTNKYRGQGVVNLLILAHINKQQSRKRRLKKVQIILAKDNENALKAYIKAGFATVLEKYQTNAEVLKYLPTQTKILMEKSIS